MRPSGPRRSPRASWPSRPWRRRSCRSASARGRHQRPRAGCAGRLTEEPREPLSRAGRRPGAVPAGAGSALQRSGVGRRDGHEEAEAQSQGGGVEQAPGQKAGEAVSRPESSAPGQHRRRPLSAARPASRREVEGEGPAARSGLADEVGHHRPLAVETVAGRCRSRPPASPARAAVEVPSPHLTRSCRATSRLSWRGQLAVEVAARGVDPELHLGRLVAGPQTRLEPQVEDLASRPLGGAARPCAGSGHRGRDLTLRRWGGRRSAAGGPLPPASPARTRRPMRDMTTS